MGTNKELAAPKLWLVLARCYRAMAAEVERSIADLGLCLSDFMVLEALLHKSPLTTTEIQAKVLLASGSMTAAVDRVEKLGFVVRTTTAADRRARVLDLTPKGRRLIEETYAKHAHHIERLIGILNPCERRSLYTSLKKLGLSVAAPRERSAETEEIKQ